MSQINTHAYGDYISQTSVNNPIRKPDYLFKNLYGKVMSTVGSSGYVEAFKPTNDKNVFCDDDKFSDATGELFNIDCS